MPAAAAPRTAPHVAAPRTAPHAAAPRTAPHAAAPRTAPHAAAPRTAAPGTAPHAARPAHRARPSSGRRAGRRAGAALLLAATLFEGVKYGAVAPTLLGLLGPDLALFAGIGAGLARGQLHPRAVPLYNALHSYWLPVVAMLAAIPDPMPKALFIGGLAWTAHIAIDRACGYGLRTRDGFQRGD